VTIQQARSRHSEAYYNGRIATSSLACRRSTGDGCSSSFCELLGAGSRGLRQPAPRTGAAAMTAIHRGHKSEWLERAETVGRTPITRPTFCGAANLRFVPRRDSCTAARSSYSITSSARASSGGGMVSPSALAVFRLISSSYLDACSTGRSAGSAPLRILST
jgi:hypothetical protein